MAYDNRTVTNANLFDKSSPSGAGIPDVFEDANVGWTVAEDSATQFKVEATFNTTETMRYMFSRTGATASTFKVYIGTGSDYDTFRTVNLSTAATYSGNVKIVSSISATSAIIMLQTSASGLYRNTIIYLGAIDALDSSDKNAWGIWVSGAEEQQGENYLAEGLPRNTRESMLFRAQAIETGQAASALTPFQFSPIDGDGMIYRYDGTGASSNAITPSASYTGTSLADLFNEQKYMSNRMTRIGCYKQDTRVYASGLRGSLKGLWAVYPEWLYDSVGNSIPKNDTDDILEATVRFDSKGSVNFANQTSWVIVPLTNNVKLRESLWIGPKIVAFPQN